MIELTDLDNIRKTAVKAYTSKDGEPNPIYYQAVDMQYRVAVHSEDLFPDKMFKQKASDFKRLAPKDLTETNKVVMLDKVLMKHLGQIEKELRDEILFVFQN